MGLKIPKVMIAAVKSGSGKTTVTCAFLKQLICRKKHPVSFKCGPDYIDPMFHEQVLKIPSKTLSDEFDKLSMATTSKPSFCNSTTVCEPINPKPPVTTIFIFIR